MAFEESLVIERGLATLSDEKWEHARRRAQVIAPLATLSTVSHAEADAAAAQLGISRRQVYVLIRRYRQGTGLITDLAPGISSGGKGKGRLSEPVECVIRELLHKQFLTQQKLGKAMLYRAIVQACKARGIPVPARNTVEKRIARLDPVELGRHREGEKAVRPLRSAGGTPPEILAPLQQVQIDHTVMDLIVVDERDREPIGRPYLTVAIDVYSRCLLGLVITLDPPSAVSVGLCLAHCAVDKRPWLERLAVETDWPMSGKPQSLYLDNAAEFKSEALRRGCEQHGIRLDYRPPGQPHYGGIVERVIGTVMGWVHALPGTTFSNPGQRGVYDSEKRAALTLPELERWLALAISHYHGTVHGSLRQTPAMRWAEGIACCGPPPVVTHATAFLVDFLPITRRMLTRTGFVIDHIQYFANALKPWIARRDRLSPFLIRRDPRDISRVWVLEPDGQRYLEIPYRTLSHPGITLWEQRQALARLRQRGHAQVDEADLFRMVDQMRRIAQDAQKATRKARRDSSRREHLRRTEPFEAAHRPMDSRPIEHSEASPPAKPFDQIEDW